MTYRSDRGNVPAQVSHKAGRMQKELHSDEPAGAYYDERALLAMNADPELRLLVLWSMVANAYN